MNVSIIITSSFLLCAFMAGTVMARSPMHEARPEQHAQEINEESSYLGYGRKMHKNSRYDGYCTERDSNCSRYRKVSKMSYHERQMLRQQVNEAGKQYDHH